MLLAGAISHRVSVPLRELAQAARDVGGGALGTTALERGDREVREAIAAFNRMSLCLRDLDAAARALRAREHLTELGEMARGLAHMLRSPLHALGLSVEELAGRLPRSGGAEPLAESARHQIRRIDQSIRSFLALSSESVAAPGPVSILPLIQDVVLEALQDARGRVKIVVEASDAPPPLDGVAPEIRAMVQALVVNAVEATPAAGRVTVRVHGSKAGATIAVEDEGPGVPEEIRKRLFTPHVSSKAHGSGMGLFLTHRIATTRYGGSLELQGLSPRGTRAVLTLSPRGAPLDHA